MPLYETKALPEGCETDSGQIPSAVTWFSQKAAEAS